MSATPETEVGELQVQGLPRLQSELKARLINLVIPCLKIKRQEGWNYSSVIQGLGLHLQY